MTDHIALFAHPASRIAYALFRAHGLLLAIGDRVTEPVGLTSARWQVMGQIVVSGGGLPAAQIARNLELTRQSVQRVLDDLARLGMVDWADNPNHRRAKLAVLTDAGLAAFDAAAMRWQPMADAIVSGLGTTDADQLDALLARLSHILDQPIIPEG